MFRPAVVRLAAGASSRGIVLRQPHVLPRASHQHILQPIRLRTYATDPPPASTNNAPMWIVLGALVALAGGGYYYMKPVRDAASSANQAMGTVRDQASGLGDSASALSGVAKSMLPPGAFALYSALASQEGGVTGFLSSLKDKDVQGVLEEVKKFGGDDVKRVVEKVEKKVKEANGNVSKVDWPALAKELKGELPAESQKYVDVLLGSMPSMGNIDDMIKKAKEMGGDQLKQVEQAASKILAEVNKAKKDGKGQADAFISGLKQAAPADLDSLIQQLKDAAKKAGLPADQAEAWLKHKAGDEKVDVDSMVKQLEEKLRSAAKFIPGNPKDLIDQVNQVSPSVAQLLLQAMVQSGITDEKGNRK